MRDCASTTLWVVAVRLQLVSSEMMPRGRFDSAGLERAVAWACCLSALLMLQALKEQSRMLAGARMALAAREEALVTMQTLQADLTRKRARADGLQGQQHKQAVCSAIAERSYLCIKPSCSVLPCKRVQLRCCQCSCWMCVPWKMVLSDSRCFIWRWARPAAIDRQQVHVDHVSAVHLRP